MWKIKIVFICTSKMPDIGLEKLITWCVSVCNHDEFVLCTIQFFFFKNLIWSNFFEYKNVKNLSLNTFFLAVFMQNWIEPHVYFLLNFVIIKLFGKASDFNVKKKFWKTTTTYSEFTWGYLLMQHRIWGKL